MEGCPPVGHNQGDHGRCLLADPPLAALVDIAVALETLVAPVVSVDMVALAVLEAIAVLAAMLARADLVVIMARADRVVLVALEALVAPAVLAALVATLSIIRSSINLADGVVLLVQKSWETRREIYAMP